MDILDDVIKAVKEERFADALANLLTAYNNVACARPGSDKLSSMTMFVWSQLVPQYAPARQAWMGLRDEQVAQLSSGDNAFGDPQGFDSSRSRFVQICDMNRILGDGSATHTLFAYLAQAWPALAAQGATLALPAVVEAGNFQLATRYLNNPMKLVASLNQVALTNPLSAPGRTTLRLLAELMNFAKDLQLHMATLTGLARPRKPMQHAIRPWPVSPLTRCVRSCNASSCRLDSC